MKNLLNCHSVGLHSFPISFENGLYKRVFYADSKHFMWRPFEIAVHPHHVDIRITVLEGALFNPIFKIGSGESVKKWRWRGHLTNPYCVDVQHGTGFVFIFVSGNVPFFVSL